MISRTCIYTIDKSKHDHKGKLLFEIENDASAYKYLDDNGYGRKIND